MSAVITRKIVARGREVVKEITVAAGASVGLEGEVIPGVTTDKSLAIAFPVTGLKYIFMNSTKDLLLQTNSGSAPTNSISLVANEPYDWKTGDPEPCLITGAVTVIYATNAGADDATLDIEVGYDATP